jgi:hypothetical protein
MKLLTMTAALALLAATPMLAGTALADDKASASVLPAKPDKQTAASSQTLNPNSNTGIIEPREPNNQTATVDQSSNPAFNPTLPGPSNQQAMNDQGQGQDEQAQGLTPEGGQGGNLDEAGRAQESGSQKSGSQASDQGQESADNAQQQQAQANENSNPVDTTAIARNDLDPNQQRVQQEAQAKADQMTKPDQMDNDQPESEKAAPNAAEASLAAAQ